MSARKTKMVCFLCGMPNLRMSRGDGICFVCPKDDFVCRFRRFRASDISFFCFLTPPPIYYLASINTPTRASLPRVFFWTMLELTKNTQECARRENRDLKFEQINFNHYTIQTFFFYLFKSFHFTILFKDNRP